MSNNFNIVKNCKITLFTDELVARFKFTVLLLPNGNIKITGLPFDTSHYKSDHVVSDTEKREQVLQTDKSGKLYE